MTPQDRHFRQLLEERWSAGKFVCIGLDTDPDKVPEVVVREPDDPHAFLAFNKAIIEATGDIAGAFKFNSAFYEAHGVAGLMGLRDSIRTAHRIAPGVPVILDAKRADIDNTNNGYVRFAFDIMQADAITVSPYLGRKALKPFLECKNKGIFVLCRTSNDGAGEFQDLECGGLPLYVHVARKVATTWNENGNCGVVAGATRPSELATVRFQVNDLPILIPGIGAQGGDVEATVKAGQCSRGRGMLVNSSRGIIYASSGNDFASAARLEALRLHELITSFL